MENQNEKVNDVNEEVMTETEEVMSVKDSLKELGKSVKHSTNKTVAKVAPKVKKAFWTGVKICAGVAVAYKAGEAIGLIGKNDENADNQWTDDEIIDGTTSIDVGDGTITFEPKEDEPTAETTEE